MWLEAHGYRPEYTWGLLDLTARRVEDELSARGWWRCKWELERVGNPGSPGRLIGWGRMWANEGRRS